MFQTAGFSLLPVLPNDHKPETCGEATIFPPGKVDFENFFSFSRHRRITAVA
jgi:hypothetical protein